MAHSENCVFVLAFLRRVGPRTSTVKETGYVTLPAINMQPDRGSMLISGRVPGPWCFSRVWTARGQLRRWGPPKYAEHRGRDGSPDHWLCRQTESSSLVRCHESFGNLAALDLCQPVVECIETFGIH